MGWIGGICREYGVTGCLGLMAERGDHVHHGRKGDFGGF